MVSITMQDIFDFCGNWYLPVEFKDGVISIDGNQFDVSFAETGSYGMIIFNAIMGSYFRMQKLGGIEALERLASVKKALEASKVDETRSK